LDNDFKEEAKTAKIKIHFRFDIDFERRSGEITLFLLNILLWFHCNIITNSSFEVVKKSTSSDTHESSSCVFSIIMAVGVILFYFKGGFNFDEKLKIKN
jgi:hypothetical protein